MTYYVHIIHIGCPTILRSDRGTENCNVAFLQPFLREACNDAFQGEKSFMYGKSTSNQVCILCRDSTYLLYSSAHRSMVGAIEKEWS